jgi:hypothetical protein
MDCAGVLAGGTRVFAAGSRPPDEVDDVTAAALGNPRIAARVALTGPGAGGSARRSR